MMVTQTNKPTNQYINAVMNPTDAELEELAENRKRETALGFLRKMLGRKDTAEEAADEAVETPEEVVEETADEILAEETVEVGREIESIEET